jgi:antitoxin HicB
MTIKPEYPVILRPLSVEDGGGWIAIVPDLPGCMSDGATAFEALKNVEGAVEEWKDAARNMGRLIPGPDASLESTLEQEVPAHIRQQAEAYARQMQGGSRSEFDPTLVHAIISEWARVAVHSFRISERDPDRDA